MSTGSTIGEKLTMQLDPDGLKFGDKHSVAVMKDGMTVGDLPKDTSCSSSYTGEQLNAKSPERKNKNIQKMLRGGLEVPYFDVKGKRCCSHYTAPQRQTEVSRQNMVVSRLGYQKKNPFQDKQMSRKNNQILSLCSFIFM